MIRFTIDTNKALLETVLASATRHFAPLEEEYKRLPLEVLVVLHRFVLMELQRRHVLTVETELHG